MKKAILDEQKNVVIVSDLEVWTRFMNDFKNCIVKQEDVNGYFVSTVFLSVDHNFYGENPYGLRQWYLRIKFQEQTFIVGDTQPMKKH
jgi:hypothetical protein